MRFLAATRSDQGLAARIRGLDPDSGLEDVVQIAREFGFSLSAGDLRAAYAHDWAMRRMHYLGRRSADSAASTVAVVKAPPSRM
jgi:hypothetical protein